MGSCGIYGKRHLNPGLFFHPLPRSVQTCRVEAVVFHLEFVWRKCIPLAHVHPDQQCVRHFVYSQYEGICHFELELLYWFLKMRDLNFQWNPVLEISLVRFPNLARLHWKLKAPKSLYVHRSSLVERAQTCLVFKFTFQCECWFPHSSISAFPPFFPLRPAHHFTDINSCCFILWLLLPLTINACMNNFDSSFTFNESVPGLLWSPMPKEEWNANQQLVRSGRSRASKCKRWQQPRPCCSGRLWRTSDPSLRLQTDPSGSEQCIGFPATLLVSNCQDP